MNQPIHDDELNRVLLKPRFKMKFNESKEDILEQFRLHIEKDHSDYISKIVDHHIVIDVANEKEHFWSPQLHVEIETEEGFTIVKGILGPLLDSLWADATGSLSVDMLKSKMAAIKIPGRIIHNVPGRPKWVTRVMATIGPSAIPKFPPTEKIAMPEALLSPVKK